MRWSDISFAPQTKTLRQFAAFWIVFLGGLACWHGFMRGNTWTAVILAVLALTVGPLGLVRPQAVRRVYVGAMILAFPIGWLVSKAMLVVLFYGIFTPIAFIFRLMGRDALGLERCPESATYWTPKVGAAGPERYLRQF